MKVPVSLAIFIFFVLLGLSVGVMLSFPDGKLHIVFCDVGQGDGMYLKMPNGADVVIDGGPNDKILTCIGSQMPFYDRVIDLVILTHPQKDHFHGLTSVFKRYTVKHFLTVPVGHTTEEYLAFSQAVVNEAADLSYFTRGEHINLGDVSLTSIWPDQTWLENKLPSADLRSELIQAEAEDRLIKTATQDDLNQFSMYIHLRYHDFDLLLTGDGDKVAQEQLKAQSLTHLIPKKIEVLKVPHHGSSTGMQDWFIQQVNPAYAVIQVGKNSYGHPHPSTLNQLQNVQILRNDIDGKVEITTDGVYYRVIK